MRPVVDVITSTSSKLYLVSNNEVNTSLSYVVKGTFSITFNHLQTLN